MITGLFGKTSEAKFITEIQQYNEELKLAIAEDYTNNMGNRQNKFNIRRSSYNDENTFTDAMKTKIPSFNIKYANKLEIKEDKLHYIGEDEQERAWLAQAISVAGKLRINYVYENGTEAAPTYEQVIPDGSYEVESPTISGYEPDRYMVSGEIQGDTNITVTYYQPSQGLDYELLDDGTYTVSGIGSFTGECLIIPAKYNDIDITQIKEYAFRNCQTIKTATIPSSIINFGNNIFASCNNLECLNYDSTITPGDRYFVKFNGLNIKELYIGPNVKSIGIQTFQSCKNLKKIIVCSNSVERLCASSFNGCTSLEYVKINEENTGYIVDNNVLYSKDGKTLFLYPPGKADEKFKILDTVEIIEENSCCNNQNLKNVEIPSTVKAIKGFAFSGCNKLEFLYLDAEKVEGNYAFQSSSLSKVEIGPNVKSISGATFGNCTNLTDITIYSEQTDITAYQFMSCSLLKKFKLKENHTKYNEKDGILYSKDWKTLHACPPGIEGEFEIPEGTEKLNGASMQSKYQNLTKLVIPLSIKNIYLGYFSPLENIYYNGTVEQWNGVTINKGGSTLKTVTCTDGTVNL